MLQVGAHLWLNSANSSTSVFSLSPLWNHQRENSIHTDARQSGHLWQVMLVPESKKCVLKYKQWCIWAICVFCAALTKTRSKHPRSCNWTPFMKTTTKITCSVLTVHVVWSLSPNACRFNGFKQTKQTKWNGQSSKGRAASEHSCTRHINPLVPGEKNSARKLCFASRTKI